MKTKCRLLVSLAFAMAIAALALAWRADRNPLDLYVSPPMAGTNHRISVLVPPGWIAYDEPLMGFVEFKPAVLLPWLPNWLRWGSFRQSMYEDRLLLRFKTRETLPSSVADKISIGRVEIYSATLNRNLQPEPGWYGVFYCRKSKNDFDATHTAIFNSLRLVE